MDPAGMPAIVRSKSLNGGAALHELADQALAERSVPVDEAERRRVVRCLERLQAAGQAALTACAGNSDAPHAQKFIDHLKTLSA